MIDVLLVDDHALVRTGIRRLLEDSKQINIVGNQRFEDEDLTEDFTLTPPNLFSFVTKSDQYSKQKLSADLEILRSFYLDRGYLNFNINSTQVSITPDKRDIYITINITEGEQYRIREVTLSGDLVLQPEELFPLVRINPDDVFSRKRVTEAVDRPSVRSIAISACLSLTTMTRVETMLNAAFLSASSGGVAPAASMNDRSGMPSRSGVGTLNTATSKSWRSLGSVVGRYPLRNAAWSSASEMSPT